MIILGRGIKVKKILCASMMCANFNSLQEEVEALDKANVDIYHIDIMDGNYVPNFGMGLQDFESIKKTTTKKLDVHLMINNPSQHINLFIDKGADIVYIHPDADVHPARTIDLIKVKGAKAGIAINPGIPISAVEPLLNIVDYVLIMTVNPGFAGQMYLSYVDEKILKLGELRRKRDYKFSIMIDGAISPDKIANLSPKGVEGFILGTSSLFGKDKDYSTIINNLRNL